MSSALPKPIRTLLERSIEEHLVKQVRKAGGQVRKVRWIGRRNAPDRLVMLGGWAAWPELKRPGKKATKAQEREHKIMRGHGMWVKVLSTFEEVDDFVASMLHPREV